MSEHVEQRPLSILWEHPSFIICRYSENKEQFIKDVIEELENRKGSVGKYNYMYGASRVVSGGFEFDCEMVENTLECKISKGRGQERQTFETVFPRDDFGTVNQIIDFIDNHVSLFEVHGS